MVLCDVMISKKKRGQADVLIYATSYCFTGHGPVPMYLHLCNFEIQLQNYIPCRGAYFLGRISLSGTAYSCFIVISPFVAVRSIPVWAKMVFKTDREYPKFVIQEMTVNSVCHHDYSIKRDRGKVNILLYAAPYCSSGHGPVPMSPAALSGGRRGCLL